MSLEVRRSEWFMGDLEHYAAWYDGEAGWELAERYLEAVAFTLDKLRDVPSLGHNTHFKHPELRDLRCMQVGRPFRKHLIFTATTIPLFTQNEPCMGPVTCHGALPKRLVLKNGDVFGDRVDRDVVKRRATD